MEGKTMEKMKIKKGCFLFDDESCRNLIGLSELGKHKTELIIPDGVKYIGHEIFENCEMLESITIPTSVTKIAEFAFAECENITLLVPASLLEYINYKNMLVKQSKNVKVINPETLSK